MHFGLESRVPFADIDLLEWTRQLSPTLGYHHHQEKYFLRQSVQSITPETIRTRKKSAIPKDQWAQDVYRAEALKSLESCADVLNLYVDIPRLHALIKKKTLTEKESYSLFQVIVFSHWLQAYL